VRHAASPPGRIAGLVRISVPELMGIEVLPRMLKSLRDAHPDIRIELSLSNAPADLLAQEVDIAVRTVTPKQEALVARKVASIPMGFFASVDYLARHGMPQTMAELASHDMIGPDRNPSDLAFVEKLGKDFAGTSFVLRTDSHPAQLAAARGGVGIAIAQVPVGLRDPGLRRVVPTFTVMLDTWIVTHENLSKIPRVRAVFDRLAEEFTAYVRG
jgi:DNA-binding transcriptional LysR family regulator